MNISFHNGNINPRVIEYQKKVFDFFGLNLLQIETDLPHGEAIDKWLHENEFDRIRIWDIDCIPLQAELPKSKAQLFGIAQAANHIEGKPVYVGPAFITFTQSWWIKAGKPSFRPTDKHDVGGQLSDAAKTKEMLWPVHVEQSKWDLGCCSTFGLGTTYQGGIYHAFEARMGNAQMFIDKCKEVLGE